MPITPPVKSSYTFLFRRATKYLGISDPNVVEGDSIASTAPYTADWLKKQLVQSDYEVCCLIASVTDNPYRNIFFTASPDIVANGGRIPGYIGVHGLVEVLIVGEWLEAKLAQSLEHLQRARDKFNINPLNIPESSKRLYYIDNGIFYVLAGGSGRIQLPTIPLADDTATPPVLNAPKAYQYAVLGHTLMTARPVGANNTHRTDWTNIWAGYVQMILSGSASLPEPERMQRIAT